MQSSNPSDLPAINNSTVTRYLSLMFWGDSRSWDKDCKDQDLCLLLVMMVKRGRYFIYTTQSASETSWLIWSHRRLKLLALKSFCTLVLKSLALNINVNPLPVLFFFHHSFYCEENLNIHVQTYYLHFKRLSSWYKILQARVETDLAQIFS